MYGAHLVCYTERNIECVKDGLWDFQMLHSIWISTRAGIVRLAFLSLFPQVFLNAIMFTTFDNVKTAIKQNQSLIRKAT